MRRCDLKDGDFIRIDAGQGLRCDFSERIIEEERNIVSPARTARRDAATSATMRPRSTASASPHRGDMVCVMGGSGSGKSTLLRAIAGQLRPRAARCCSTASRSTRTSNDSSASSRYIPQDDAFDDHLTVEENLSYAAAIRSPHL